MGAWATMQRNAGLFGIFRASLVSVVMLAISVVVGATEPGGWLVGCAFVAGSALPLPLRGLLATRPPLTQAALNGSALVIVSVALLGRSWVAGWGNLGLAVLVGAVMAYLSTWFLFMSHPEVGILHDRR